MKRILFAVAAGVALASTAAPANAAFLLTAQIISGTGPGGGNTGVVQPFTQTSSTLVPGNAGGVIDLFDGDLDSGTNLRFTYNITNNPASGQLVINNVEVTYSNVNPLATLPPLQVRLTATEDAVTVPAGTGPVEFFSSLSATGAPGNTIDTSATASQVGGGSATATSGGTRPVAPPLSPPLTNQTLTFTRGTGAGTLSATALLTLGGFTNTTFGAELRLSPTTVNPIPAPATALMFLATAPVLGLVRRFRRTTTAA